MWSHACVTMCTYVHIYAPICENVIPGDAAPRPVPVPANATPSDQMPDHAAGQGWEYIECPICMHAHTHTYIGTCKCMRARVKVCRYAHMHNKSYTMSIHRYIHMHTPIYTYIGVAVHVYVHAYVCMLGFMLCQVTRHRASHL